MPNSIFINIDDNVYEITEWVRVQRERNTDAIIAVGLCLCEYLKVHPVDFDKKFFGFFNQLKKLD